MPDRRAIANAGNDNAGNDNAGNDNAVDRIGLSFRLSYCHF
jgi:hypothetical protein